LLLYPLVFISIKNLIVVKLTNKQIFNALVDSILKLKNILYG